MSLDNKSVTLCSQTDRSEGYTWRVFCYATWRGYIRLTKMQIRMYVKLLGCSMYILHVLVYRVGFTFTQNVNYHVIFTSSVSQKLFCLGILKISISLLCTSMKIFSRQYHDLTPLSGIILDLLVILLSQLNPIQTPPPIPYIYTNQL
jgi:hypothetical protein